MNLTPFGHVVAATETHGYPTWEQWAVAHLSQPCDEPQPCDLHREWEQHKATTRTITRPARKVTAEQIEARLGVLQHGLSNARADLAAFLRANATSSDPAVVNLALRSRPGRLTEAKVAKWSRLNARIARLEHRIALDKARLERLRGVA